MQQVEIRIKGHVDRHWSDWIIGFAVSFTPEGETVLTGFVRDRSALYGLLDRIADLGLDLVSVTSHPGPRGRGMKLGEGGGTR